MTGKEILLKMKEKVGLGSSDADSGKGKSKMSKHVTHGFHLVKGKSHHAMEDYVVARFKPVDEHELGLFAIFDGHLSHDVPDYLRTHLFDNILKEDDFWTEPEKAVRRAYRITDTKILEKAVDFGKGGSTAVTAILINCQKLVVANVGDSRAVICKNGVAKQLSVDHEPSVERESIEERGGFVSNFPGDVPRVDGQLAVARAFGDKSLKKHLSSEPDKSVEFIENDTEFVILASDGLWKLMRVYGALMWSLMKVLTTPEVMRVYIGLSILMISLLPLHGKGKVSEWNFTLHELQLCFGVKEFLAIAPQSASGVVLDAPEAF